MIWATSKPKLSLQWAQTCLVSLSDSKVQPSSPSPHQTDLALAFICSHSCLLPLLCCIQVGKGWWGASPVFCAPFWVSTPLSRMTLKYWQSCWTSFSQNDYLGFHFSSLSFLSWKPSPLLTVSLLWSHSLKNSSKTQPYLSHRLLVLLLLICNSVYTKTVNIVFLSKNSQALKFFMYTFRMLSLKS